MVYGTKLEETAIINSTVNAQIKTEILAHFQIPSTENDLVTIKTFSEW